MKKSTLSLALAVILSTTMTMCTKPQLSETQTVQATKSLFLPKAFTDSIKQNQDLAIKMSNDVDWKALKKYSEECLSILIAKNIDLNDESNYNTQTFYGRLGDDSKAYKDKMVAGKKHAKAFMTKYYPNLDQCSSCSVLDPARKLAYAKTLNSLKNAKNQNKANILASNQKIENIVAESLADVKAPDCWNLKFFACGGICALTIELPPAFALCIALCVAEYCTTT